MRASASAGPPGGNGTRMRTGLLGYGDVSAAIDAELQARNAKQARVSTRKTSDVVCMRSPSMTLLQAIITESVRFARTVDQQLIVAKVRSHETPQQKHVALARDIFGIADFFQCRGETAFFVLGHCSRTDDERNGRRRRSCDDA